MKLTTNRLCKKGAFIGMDGERVKEKGRSSAYLLSFPLKSLDWPLVGTETTEVTWPKSLPVLHGRGVSVFLIDGILRHSRKDFQTLPNRISSFFFFF